LRIQTGADAKQKRSFARTFDRNQLIVGPQRWAYKVLRHTLGERFMVAIAACVFIKDFWLRDRLACPLCAPGVFAVKFLRARNRACLRMLPTDFFSV
jgi:hypothetical protein